MTIYIVYSYRNTISHFHSNSIKKNNFRYIITHCPDVAEYVALNSNQTFIMTDI